MVVSALENALKPDRILSVEKQSVPSSALLLFSGCIYRASSAIIGHLFQNGSFLGMNETKRLLCNALIARVENVYFRLIPVMHKAYTKGLKYVRVVFHKIYKTIDKSEMMQMKQHY